MPTTGHVSTVSGLSLAERALARSAHPHPRSFRGVARKTEPRGKKIPFVFTRVQYSAVSEHAHTVVLVRLAWPQQGDNLHQDPFPLPPSPLPPRESWTLHCIAPGTWTKVATQVNAPNLLACQSNDCPSPRPAATPQGCATLQYCTVHHQTHAT